ncbi:DUF2294 domain-containing protein [Paenibacillus sp. 1P07SE]|uniref:DUF2294 domain-containing protein n=1 Tax=Paenibacillus sp. 1P07SE TaxID=3132209 RepID=UPI0039A696F4
MKTKGKIEAEISMALTQWEKDFLGRGSVIVKADILRNMVVVVLKGVLTPAEKLLSEQKNGMLSVKRIRSDLVEAGRKDLGDMIGSITEERVVSFHTDLSTQTGERVMVFMLERNLEERLTSKTK